MSRRCHHGAPRHPRPAARERRRPASPTKPVGTTPRLPDGPPGVDVDAAEPIELSPDLDDAAVLEATAAIDVDLEADNAVEQPIEAIASLAETGPEHEPPRSADVVAPVVFAPPMNGNASNGHAENGHAPLPFPPNGHEAVGLEHNATAPQLRRFIKSRAYVPMHELRRRFAINGGEDDVTPIQLDRQWIYVGLPLREGSLLGELLRAGDIGYELSMDPIAPIVVGVYPMRPVPRS